MAGLIRRGDIDEVRARVNIADIVGDYVTLKSAGVGSLKGLCPFHDERSPSFHVRPQVGRYHCFGCGEDGDIFTFLQKMDHSSFTEAVERMAARIGFELHYEDGGAASSDQGNRARLLAANAAAAEYFVAQLGSPEADAARVFLGERGFSAAAAARFGVGFAPKSFSALGTHLATLGFTETELLTAGLLSQGERGAYDRFRGRVVWPIRDVTGQTLGFGARRLFEDDKGPKYLNTPETPVYHKSSVLYGIDLAKRDISRNKQVVVVEGYTDVMACHLAGVTTAVATCGTSFGVDHIKVVRRMLGDVDNADTRGLGEVVFTFDPDEAGQKAASRAFSEEQRFAAQTFVAVAPEGLDPCDLRLRRGDDAIRRLIEAKKPMFEFMVRRVLDMYDLDTVEGRVAALRAAVPVVATIRDQALNVGYVRTLAGWLGVDPAEVSRAVSASARETAAPAGPSRQGAARPGTARPGATVHAMSAAGSAAGSAATGSAARGSAAQGIAGQGSAAQGSAAQSTGQNQSGSTEAGQNQSGANQRDAPAASSWGTGNSGAPTDVSEPSPSITSLPSDLATRLERDAVMALLQHPEAVDREVAVRAASVRYANVLLGVVRDAIAATMPLWGDPAWLERVIDETPLPFVDFVRQLGLAPLPVREGTDLRAYCTGVVSSLIDRDLLRIKAELLGQLQRASGDAERSRQLQQQLMTVEGERRRLRDE